MWVRVAKAGDLAPERACVVRAGGIDMALVCTTDGVVAMDNLCPHSGGALGEGMVQGCIVTCPLHGWEFDTKTGASLTEKRPNQKLYAVKLDKDDVLVEVPDVGAQPESTDSSATAVAPLDETAPEAAAGESAMPALDSAPPEAGKRSPVEVWKQSKHGM